MKKVFYLAFVLCSLYAPTCEKKGNFGIYDNCCGTAPVADEITLLMPADSSTTVGKVYIPNIFVPDTSAGAQGDCFFLVFGNSGVLQIELFRLTSESGQLLHEQTHFQPSLANAAWRGVGPDGALYYGSFNYEVKVAFSDGQKKTYTGKACSFECGSGDFPAQNLPDCFFTNQNSGDGGYDQSIPYPADCF